MCATCVAQGVAYVGGAVAGLQVLAARARRHRAPGSLESPRGPAAHRGESDVGADGQAGVDAAPGDAAHRDHVDGLTGVAGRDR